MKEGSENGLSTQASKSSNQENSITESYSSMYNISRVQYPKIDKDLFP